MTADYPPIPYGDADFRRIRLTGSLYVDKTRFLRLLEDARFAVLARPRRFGKSCWVSLLESYYDRRGKDEFDTVFGGTDIGREPTDERHRYVVLRFDFSAIGGEGELETIEAEFENYCTRVLRYAMGRHSDLFPDRAADRILAASSVSGKLGSLFLYAANGGIPLYVLVDEYDFANTVLAKHGAEAYQRFFGHSGGFHRSFFATLKAGAGMSGGGLERLFITGVLPISLNDVTGGFNIGQNLSLDSRFNEMYGFTEAEVRGLLEDYRVRGALDFGVDEALATMRDWHDGYRFSEDAETSVYNTDMVLHYLMGSIPNRSGPRDLIAENARGDYDKLRRLLKSSRELNGNFDLLRQIADEERVVCDLHSIFPPERLFEREYFLSLMHYFGLLSIREAKSIATVLGIPNRTMKRLLDSLLA